MTTDLEKIVMDGETVDVEFKLKPNEDVKKYLKTVVAFSNGYGGTVIFGVSDDGTVPGLTGDPFRVMDEVTDRVSSEISPQVSALPYVSTIGDRSVVVLRVEPGAHRPYYMRKEGVENGTYIRTGATTRRCDPETLTDLRLQGQFRCADMSESIGDVVKEDDGRLETIRRIARDHGSKEPSTEHLYSIGLLAAHDGVYSATTGLNLLTRNDHPFARLECARFKGTEKGEFSNKKTCSGTIVDQIGCAVSFLDSNLVTDVRFECTRRVDTLEIPMEALREFVVNAVAHRSYSMSSPVYVSVYDDRVEIESPGSIPYGLTVADVSHGKSRPRNRAVCSFLRDIGLMEGWGSGIMKSIRLCEESHLETPLLTDEGDSFRVTVFRRNHRPAIAADAPLSSNDTAVIKLLSKNPNCTINEISDITGIARSSVYKSVTELKRRGILKRIGSRKTGEWHLEDVDSYVEEGPEGPL